MDDQDDEDFGFFDFSKLQQGFNMFDMYDNDDEKYTITDSSGTTWEVTTQELFEFYSFQDHNIMDSFENIIKKLDSGLSVSGDDCEFDWNLGTSIRKGSLTIRAKLKPFSSETKKDGVKCRHSKKHVVTFTTFKYWFCPECKQDLGDA